ncbi:MAG TPA: ribosome maturation factor RimM [Solirubrobacteraceae bacterium]|nr:ribosome maturation factor RimM [Solirubrobacteraceae bacterium]
MSSSTSSTEGIVAGRVGRPHGLDGSFHVIRPRADLLAEGAVLKVAGASREVVRRAGTDQRPILRLDGCEDREAAEALRGEELWVPRAAAPAREPGEYWAEELEGCRVQDGEVVVGVVRRLVALPSCEALEVAREDDTDLLVPLVRDAVRTVDPAARRIDVDLRFLGAN